MIEQQTTVLVFGTFDLLHPGHDSFLEQAKARGDRLVVIVARDSNVEQIKAQKPQQSEQERLEAVQGHLAVDEAVLGYEDWSEHTQVLEDIQPDIVCLGYDQRAEIPDGPWIITRLEAHNPEEYKSSKIKQNSVQS